jgi:hypothetical protein
VAGLPDASGRGGLPCDAARAVVWRQSGVQTVIPYNVADSVGHASRTLRELSQMDNPLSGYGPGCPL